jgi:hypothetical protein
MSGIAGACRQPTSGAPARRVPARACATALARSAGG